MAKPIRLIGFRSSVLWSAILFGLFVVGVGGYFVLVLQPRSAAIAQIQQAVSDCRVSVQSKRWDAALEACQKAAILPSIDPESQRLIDEAGQLVQDARVGRLDFYYLRGKALLDGGDPMGALAAFEIVFNDEPGFLDVADMRRQTLVLLTPTDIATPTPTPAHTPTAVNTPTSTTTPTSRPGETPPTATHTTRPTDTPTAIYTSTPSITPTPTATKTATRSPTPVFTPTSTMAPVGLTTQTPTPPPTVDESARATNSAATVEAAVRTTLEAQAASERQQTAVAATLTALAPTWTPTRTPTKIPTATRTARPTATFNRAATAQSIGTATARSQATATAQAIATANQRETVIAKSGATATAERRATSTAQSWATVTAQARSTATQEAQDRIFQGQVTAQELNVRSGPGTDYAIVAQLIEGEWFAILGRTSDQSWLRIRTAASLDGWVFASLVRLGQAVDRYPVVVVPATPTPSACRTTVDSQLAGMWTRGEMGCPLAPSAVVWSAWQPFQRGDMLWRRDTDAAYVFYQGSGWSQLADRWNEGIPVRSRGAAPPGLQAPVRGFGYVWGEYETIHQGLGWALDKEKGFCTLIQEFEKGFLLRSSTVNSCWEGLYNHAQEPGFGLQSLKAHIDGYWQR